MTDSLADRLRAAIDETERIAQAAVGFDYGVKDWADDGDPVNVHIARHDPAAALRRCAADRKILDLYADYRSKAEVKAEDEDHWWHQAGEGAAYFRVLHLLAEAYGVEA